MKSRGFGPQISSGLSSPTLPPGILCKSYDLLTDVSAISDILSGISSDILCGPGVQVSRCPGPARITSIQSLFVGLQEEEEKEKEKKLT